MLLTSSGLAIFSDATLVNLHADMSDHSPLLLLLEERIEYKRTPDFRFENCWLQEADIGDVVTSSWTESTGGELTDRLGLCASDLSRWGKSLHKNFRAEIWIVMHYWLI